MMAILAFGFYHDEAGLSKTSLNVSHVSLLDDFPWTRASCLSTFSHLENTASRRSPVWGPRNGNGGSCIESGQGGTDGGGKLLKKENSLH